MERSGARRSDYWRGVGGKIRVRERRGEIERQTASVRKLRRQSVKRNHTVLIYHHKVEL